MFVSPIGLTALCANKRPRRLARTIFHRRSHKEVGYQQRKSRENYDAFSHPPSTGDVSEGEEFVLARVSWSRHQILSPEVSLDSSPLLAKILDRQTPRALPVSPRQTR